MAGAGSNAMTYCCLSSSSTWRAALLVSDGVLDVEERAAGPDREVLDRAVLGFGERRRGARLRGRGDRSAAPSR